MDKVEQRLSILDKVVKIGWALLFGAFVIGGWVATLESRTQAASAAIEALEAHHAKLNYEVIGVHNQHDKRITRLEDALVLIAKSLDRIENKLQTNQ